MRVIKSFIFSNLFLVVFLSYILTEQNRATTGINEHFVNIDKRKISIENKDNNGFSTYQFEGDKEIKDYCCDKENGIIRYIFLIVGKKSNLRGEKIVVLNVTPDKIVKIWEGLEGKYNPWKILFKDVDGDGNKEICLGVWKKARFHPVFDNRLFVFGWEENEIFPKWLGSRLSSPMLDFDFADIDQDGLNELISLEIQRNRLRRIIAYKWKGFGFEGFKILERDLTQDSLNEAKFSNRRSKQ